MCQNAESHFAINQSWLYCGSGIMKNVMDKVMLGVEGVVLSAQGHQVHVHIHLVPTALLNNPFRLWSECTSVHQTPQFNITQRSIRSSAHIWL